MYTQEQETVKRHLFCIVKTISKWRKWQSQWLRINESEPSDADVADIFALTRTDSAVDRIKVELSTGNYYGIFPNIPLGLTAAITVTPAETTTYFVSGFSLNGVVL
jgi:hypothetical protein